MRYLRFSGSRFITCLCAVSLCWPVAAGAQIEEVVVTAQKREENVQDVPISISTFSGTFMEDSGVDTLQDLAMYTPNLTLTQSSQVANNRIIMRGVGSVGNNAIEPSVAVFIDGVYYPRPSSVVGSLTDLEMVEVLRGPQGTLFGRNASMGALNIRTRAPSEEVERVINGSVGNHDSYRFSGSVSGAMVQDLSGRLSFHYNDRDGYGENTFDNNEEVGSWRDLGVRTKLYYTPTDNWDVTVTADYQQVDNEGPVLEVKSDTVIPAYAGIISTVLSPTPPLICPPPATICPTGPVPELTDGFDYEINQDHEDEATDEQWGVAVDMSWQVGEHTVRSISSYRDWNNDTFESALRLPADLFNRVTTYEADTFSQELQLLSPKGERFEYVAGLYYYDEDYSIDQNFDLGADFCNPAVANLVGTTAAGSGQAAAAAIAGASAGLQAQGIPAVLADPIAAGLINGTITDPAQIVALSGGAIPAPVAAGIVAQIGPFLVPGAATAIGGLAGAACAAGPQTAAIDGEFSQDVSSFALYGQATFHVTEQLRITGGVRWTDDSKDGTFTTAINNPITGPPSPAFPFGLQLRAPENFPNLEFDDDELTWMANVSYYLTDDIMAFGTYSTGFKSGGFNSEGANRTLTIDERVFNSETVDNWELGVKSTWLDNRLIANLTYFHTEISNFQDRNFDGVNFIVQNAGELTQQGIELDITARPVDQLFMQLGVSYLDSDFDSFPNATNLPAIVAATQDANRTRLAMGLPPLPVPPQDLAGERNHFSPEWQLSLVSEWADAIPNTRLSWYLRGEYQYIDDQNLGAETNSNPQSIQEGYDVFNARLGIRGANDAWEWSLFVRNAFDQEYCQTMFNQPIGTTLGLVDPVTLGGMQRCVLGTPRTYGLAATYRF